MSTLHIRELEAHLYDNDVIFAFSGAVSYKLITTAGTAIKEDLEKGEGNSKELFNVYAVFVELLQNIMNYSSQKKDEDGKSIGIGSCFVQQNKETKKFTISAGNQIENSSVSIVKQKLNKINSLDKDGLKAYFKEVRKQGKDTHDKGAGLGFLEMARKSSGKLEYQISQIDENNSYFELHIDI